MTESVAVFRASAKICANILTPSLKSFMKTIFSLPTGSLQLHRYPLQKNEKLQAWDATDEYLIEQISAFELAPKSRLLIFNDAFGALSGWAKKNNHLVYGVNDSFLSQQSIALNLKNNELDEIIALSSLDKLPDNIDLVILRLPKSNRLLTWQLQQIANLNDFHHPVIAGAKAKDIHNSTLALFEAHLGKTTTSLAKKKARLIFCEKNNKLATLPEARIYFDVPEFDINITNYPNVFSAERLDIAAYLMLKHIPQAKDIKHIIDLGCGNGILAIQAARKNPQAHIRLVDESHMAVASARENMLANGIGDDRFICQVNNCLDNFERKSADLILCNPPFHQSHTVTDHIAWQMFSDAKKVLKEKGKLVVIGNRHLGYHAKLKRFFGNARILASNTKFVIVEAIKY